MRLDAGLVRRLQLWNFLIAGALVLACLACHAVRYGLGVEPVGPFGFLYHQLNLNNEGNLPAWFASMQIAVCGLVLLVCSQSADARVRACRTQWLVLGLAFLVLSYDEAVALHERLVEPMQRYVGDSRWMTNAWVVAVLPVVAGFALYMLPLLRHLPPARRKLFIACGAIYVTGAGGVEVVSGAMRYEYGIPDVHFAITTWVEETLELAGMTLFLKAVTDWLVEVHPAR